MTAADVARRALPLLDLTSLEASDTDEKIRALCARATTPAGYVAAVCVHPRFVALSKAALAGTGVRVATVVNFPAGGTDVAAAEAETRAAVAAEGLRLDQAPVSVISRVEVCLPVASAFRPSARKTWVAVGSPASTKGSMACMWGGSVTLAWRAASSAT